MGSSIYELSFTQFILLFLLKIKIIYDTIYYLNKKIIKTAFYKIK